MQKSENWYFLLALAEKLAPVPYVHHLCSIEKMGVWRHFMIAVIKMTSFNVKDLSDFFSDLDYI